MDTKHSAKRLTARPERRKERVLTPLSHPPLSLSLHFTLLTALPAAQSIYFLLSSSLKFVFSLKQRHGYFGHYHLLSLYGPTPSFPSILFLPNCQFVVFGLTTPLITRHTVWEEEAVELKTRMSWQLDIMRWVHCWAVWTYQVTRQIPGLFVAARDKRGLGKCLDHSSHSLRLHSFHRANFLSWNVKLCIRKSSCTWAFREMAEILFLSFSHFIADQSDFSMKTTWLLKWVHCIKLVEWVHLFGVSKDFALLTQNVSVNICANSSSKSYLESNDQIKEMRSKEKLALVVLPINKVFSVFSDLNVLGGKWKSCSMKFLNKACY